LRAVFKSEEIPQIDGWGIVIFLLLLEFLSVFLLIFIEKNLFPSLSSALLSLVVQIFDYVLILVFCLTRFGSIDLVELVPDRRDALILIVALLIEFWVFGLLVGSEGIRNDSHKSLQELATSQYWVALFCLIGLVPLVEEGVFRRYFFEIQCQHYSTTMAILITAGVASLFHFPGSLFNFLWHFLQQVFLSLVYVKSRLGVSVLVHVFINAMVFFLSR